MYVEVEINEFDVLDEFVSKYGVEELFEEIEHRYRKEICEYNSSEHSSDVLFAKSIVSEMQRRLMPKELLEYMMAAIMQELTIIK